MKDREMERREKMQEHFRFFHIRDAKDSPSDYHYHDVAHMVFLLSGCVTYVMEGKSYTLQAGDVLLIPKHRIHMLRSEQTIPCERIVLWLNETYLRSYDEQAELLRCFAQAQSRDFHLLRFSQERWQACRALLEQLEEAVQSEEYGHRLLADTLFLQLLLTVNQESLRERPAAERSACRSDAKIDEVIRYIPTHLQEDLSVETLSERFSMSRYYLMHRFKEVSGTTIHRYISQKRLLHADELIRSGVPVLKAAERAGFRDYSTFLRAYRTAFGVKPRENK